MSHLRKPYKELAVAAGDYDTTSQDERRAKPLRSFTDDYMAVALSSLMDWDIRFQTFHHRTIATTNNRAGL